METEGLKQATADIVTAYVAKHTVGVRELPDLIRHTYAALANRGKVTETPSEPREPAVPIKKSVSHEHITCLEDGKQFKSLKRHIWTDHNLTPEQYRSTWGLPKDYPMAAPAYSENRSNLALAMGLGQKGGRKRKAA